MPIIDFLLVNTISPLLLVTLRESALFMESCFINLDDSYVLSYLASILTCSYSREATTLDLPLKADGRRLQNRFVHFEKKQRIFDPYPKQTVSTFTQSNPNLVFLVSLNVDSSFQPLFISLPRPLKSV
jgi:hypothetical protein